MATNEKMVYEEKAARINEENAAKMILEGIEASSSPGPNSSHVGQQDDNKIFECLWDNCDFQFEDVSDCIEHAVAEGCGHVQQYFAAVPPSGWYNCSAFSFLF